MNEVMQVSHRALNIHNALRTFVRYGSSDDNYFKRVQKDNKSMFGTLLETKKQKVARQKQEKWHGDKRILAMNDAQDVDTEFSWVQGMSRNVRKIQFPPKLTPKHRKKLLQNGSVVEDEKFLDSKAAHNSEKVTDNGDQDFGLDFDKTIGSLSDVMTEVPVYEKRIFKKDEVSWDLDMADLEENKYAMKGMPEESERVNLEEGITSSNLIAELPKYNPEAPRDDERVVNLKRYKSLRNLTVREIEGDVQNVGKEEERKIVEGDAIPKNMKIDLSTNKSKEEEPVVGEMEIKKIQLPRIIISKMTTFPIFDSSKKLVVRKERTSWIDQLKKKIPSLSSAGDPENAESDSEIVSISQYEDRRNLVFPSVTRILSATMSEASKLNLELWKQRMILELGQEGFVKYSEGLLRDGKQFHSMVQNKLTKKPFDMPPEGSLAMESVQNVLQEIYSVEAVETHAVHSKLHYRGIVDCIAWYRDKLCVIDWKKSDKPKKTIDETYDAPLQVASYIGALNTDKNYPFEVKNGLIVVAYTNGDPASIHELNEANLQKYWRFWLRRLQKYHMELIEL